MNIDADKIHDLISTVVTEEAKAAQLKLSAEVLGFIEVVGRALAEKWIEQHDAVVSDANDKHAQ